MNKNFRRIISLILCVAMLVTFASCRDTAKTPVKKPAESVSSEAGSTSGGETTSEITDSLIGEVTDDQIFLPEEILPDGGELSDGMEAPFINQDNMGDTYLPQWNGDDTLLPEENTGDTFLPENDAGDNIQSGGDATLPDNSGDGNDLIGDIDTPDGGYEILIDRPETEGLISTGVKLSYSFDEEVDDPILDGDIGIDDDFFLDEDLDLGENTYTSLIQKQGEKVSGKTRKITVQNSTDGIVFTDFSGLSANVFPTTASLNAQKVVGDAEAFMESSGERFNDVALRYGRAWFQIDWIVTNEAGDNWTNYKENPEDNPDYKNYMNGIYCFSEGQKTTDNFDAAVKYFQMLEEAGTEVYLAFGWKVGTRVQDWFGAHPTRGDIAAPRDLKAYAKAAAALFKYMRNEVGLTNFNTLAFYNEPNRADDLSYQGSWDFVCAGDKTIYWASMARACQEEFDRHDDLKDVLIMGADDSEDMKETGENYVNPYLRNNAPDAVDCYTFHYYGYSSTNGQNYDNYFDKCVFAYNYYEKPCYITEYYTSHYDIPVSDGEDGAYTWTDWNRSLGSLYIASANTGMRGAFKWTAVVSVLPDPSAWGNSDGENISWMRPIDVESINTVKHAYYQEALLNNYVPGGANVHNITWTGDDIRASAFTSKDGEDFSLVIEANEKSSERSLQINLEEALGKDVYLYWYNFNQITDGNAIIPQCMKTFQNVEKTFSFSIDGNYGLYVFSTIKPLKQVTLFEKGTNNLGTAFNLEAGDSVTVAPEFIDCNGDETVKWEVKRYSGAIKSTTRLREDFMKNDEYLNRGTLTQDGNEMTYTVGDKAESGEIVAIRCTIVDGDDDVKNDRYAVTTIMIS